jgi:TonB-linked SusC/RagA family outer membrane protein
MKKKLTWHGEDLCCQFFRKMKITLLLLLVSIASVYAVDSYAQATKLTLQFSDKAIKEVLYQVEEQSEFRFFYNENVNVEQKITVDIKNKTVFDMLDEVLAETDIQYRVIGRQIALYNETEGFTGLAAQQSSVSGTVTSTKGEPLPGVTVVINGTSTGTVTNADGTFSLNALGNDILTFSFIGMKTQEVSINNRTSVNVVLEEETFGIEEVVAIGYGTQRKRDITGAVSSVKGDVLSEIPVPSVEQSLSGRAAGVQVITGSGVPGAGASIRVRGVGTLNNNEPLYVIDGIIIGNVAGGGQSSVSPLSMINPNDIESIDILKDASATAIYGARAGNGVVIITTKRGKGQKLNIAYEAYTAVNVLDNSNFNQMSGPEWADFYDKEQKVEGFNDYKGQPFINRILAGENIPTYDWVDEITRNGKINSHNLSVSAGGEKSNYYSSLSYFNQDGIIYGSDLERFTARFNSDHKIGKITFGNTLYISRNIANTRGNIDPNNNNNDYLNRALRVPVYKPIYREDGTYAGVNSHDPDAEGLLDQENMHIIWHAKDNINLNSSNRVLASIYLDYEIIDGLVFHTMGSVDFGYTKNEYYGDYNDIEGTMRVLPKDTRMSLSQIEERTWFIENTLTFNKTLFTDHTITAMAGFQAQNYLRTNFSANDGSFENTDYWFFNRPHLQKEIKDAQGNIILVLPEFLPTVGNGQAETGINSYFGRINYDYKEKYLLTATVRRDGSSKFGPDKRWGTFPAVSAGWRITEENFMPELPWLSNLKLRAGYGVSGSDNVSNYQYASSVGQGGEFNYSFNGGEVDGATLNRLANTFLSWEEIKMSNVALDIGLFDSRVNISADYYDKTTSDLFLPFAPALELGNESNPNGNLGEVSNKGFDLTINTVNMQGDFTWTTDFVLGTVKNRIIKLPENADRFISDGWQNNPVNISRVGEEIGAIYGYVLDGIFQNWDEVYNHAYQNQKVLGFDENNMPIYDTGARDEATARAFNAPGDFRFKDLNGDGRIDADNDRTIIGSTIPNFTWGLNNTLSYKGLGLAVFFQGVHGVDVYNSLKGDYYRRDRLDAWNGEGSTNSEPRISGTGNGRLSAYQVENASFIRLKNLRLAYDIPQRLIEKIGMARFQIYATGTNLFTITDYTGYDPEVGLRTAGDNETAGIDNGQYPLTRQYTLGIHVSF